MKIENNKKSGSQSTVQNRYQSKYTWLAILAVVMFLLGHYGLYERLGIDEVWLTTLFDLVWSALAGIGIVNNPTDRVNW